MYEQKLYEYKRNIPITKNVDDVENIERQVNSIVTDDYIYSYIVHVRCDDEFIATEYVIKYMVSEDEENNISIGWKGKDKRI